MGKLHEAYIRQPEEIAELEPNKKVVLFFDDGSEYHGIFKKVAGDEIILKSEKSSSTIGLPLQRLTQFWERLK